MKIEIELEDLVELNRTMSLYSAAIAGGRNDLAPEQWDKFTSTLSRVLKHDPKIWAKYNRIYKKKADINEHK